MDNWDEIRTAFNVAREWHGQRRGGGIWACIMPRSSGISTRLEERLGVKLFQRHARGYTPTEAGEDLMRVAQATDDQFAQLSGRIKGQGNDVSGDLVVTSLGQCEPFAGAGADRVSASPSRIVARYLTGDRLFRLEYGEAHVAVRAGAAPDQPDNVVQPFVTQDFTLVCQ